jgi:Family of unknown function (DUF6345)/FlgD Ig-like domain
MEARHRKHRLQTGIMKLIIKGASVGLTILFAHSTTAQTNLNFNGITATSERAIRLSWNSSSNEVYTIQYANELVDTNTGTITWRPLYIHYPSHGTNTIIGDYGNYNLETNIVHPKYSPMRFYRIVNEGTNDGPAPFVVISSLTNGSVLSGEIIVSVVATSTFPALNMRLYVDGQEMDMPDDGTNFVINTCEWANGTHTLFATAKAQSSFSGPSGAYSITIGRAVSPYITVTFDNLISRIAFSQPFFEPSLGQTQQVTASFATNVDWTLQIVNDESNVVRTVTGSGTSLKYDWDGTGDGGAHIPDGVYYFTIAAQINGMALAAGGDDEESLTTSLLAEDFVELWAMPADGSGDPVPFNMYPPDFDTNGLVFFEATQSEVYPQSASVSSGPIDSLDSGGFEMQGAGASGASSQSSTAPKRPPTAPIKNSVNNYAVGFYNFQTAVTRNNPKNGMPFPATQTIRLDGSTASQSTSTYIPEANMNSVGMIQAMKKQGWKLAFQKFDDSLPINSIRRSDQGYGGGEVFTQATIGLFMDHGSYGTTLDYNPGASGSYQTYFPSGRTSDGTGESSWLRMCQFGFGGNLKWMAILACNSICDPNWNSMVNAGAIPLKSTHLLCGAASIAWMGENIAGYWAQNMIKSKQKITDAWFNAASKQYHEAAPGAITNTVIFRVTGYPECMDDKVSSYTDPSNPSPSPGNLTKQDQQVYP